jgi:long-chain acyl-CoA synthetase
MNYYKLLRYVRRNKRNKNFLIINEKAYNYNNFYNEVCNVKNLLKNNITGEGKTILIFSKNLYFQLISFFSFNGLNNIPIICHHSLPYKLIKEIIFNNSIDYLISDEKLEFNNEEVLGDISEDISSIYLYKFTFKERLFHNEHICFGALTSGSTNIPKVLYRTYESWTDFFNIQNNVFKINSKSILFINGSLSFTGNLNALLSVLYEGGTVVIIENLSPKKWIKSIKNNSVDCIYLIPSKLQLLSKSLKEELNNIKSIFSGSELLYNEIADNLKSKIPNSEIILYYGASELSFITYITYEEMKIKPLSVGRPFDNINIFIKDSCIYIDTKYHVNGIEVPYSVNDTGYIDSDGYLFLLGRKEEIINKNGVKVNLLKIEQEIKMIKDIIDCSAIYYVNNLNKVIIAVFIISNKDIEKNYIIKKCKERLIQEEIPKDIFFVKYLPLNDSGKIDKIKLKKIIENKI